MAPVNTVVNAAPPAVRERLLVELLGMLQRPVYGPVR
jgi:sphinganine-1-phosphate aldolase